jgi:hypothetical protein
LPRTRPCPLCQLLRPQHRAHSRTTRRCAINLGSHRHCPRRPRRRRLHHRRRPLRTRRRQSRDAGALQIRAVEVAVTVAGAGAAPAAAAHTRVAALPRLTRRCPRSLQAASP